MPRLWIECLVMICGFERKLEEKIYTVGKKIEKAECLLICPIHSKFLLS